MRRIFTFDGIRAISISGIVACHLCYATGHGVMGQYLGGTFNVVFFLLSATLLGLNVNKVEYRGGGSQSTWVFLSKRIIRLESSLLPFLLLLGVFFVVAGVDFSTKAYLENIVMLGWFAKLPGLGHLWFVTMIMACYVMFSVLQKHSERFKRIWLWLPFIPLQMLFEMNGFPGYFFLVLMYCGLAFIHAHDIMQLLSKACILPTVCVALIINVSVVCLLECEMIAIGHLSYYYATVLSGLSMFALLFKLFQTRHHGDLLYWVSGISYELYLVHHPLCQGPLNLFCLLSTLPSWIVVLLIMAVSLVGAFVLHKLSEYLSKICLSRLYSRR